MSLPRHPRAPFGRAGAALHQVQIIERAGALIPELGIELERKLDSEARPSERLRMLRETTNRITRAANDAVAAYRIALRAITADVERGGPNVASAIETRARLDAARTNVLEALEAANRRYPGAGAVGGAGVATKAAR